MRPRRAAAFEQLSEFQRRYLETGDRDHPGGGFGFLLWSFDRDAVASTWQSVGSDLVREWAALHPGTRPSGWWEYAAPSTPIPNVRPSVLDDRAAQRRRLGGIGTPQYEVLNVAPRFAFGLPVDWVDAFDEQYYNGRARDIHGKPIGTDFREGQFSGRAPRADDPPTFESQATYLARHDLLLDGERDRIPPAGWTPEAIAIPADTRDVREAFPAVFATPVFDELERPQ
jgi:hypothetical protein